ncbi:MAG: glycosyltransferase family 2 protein [Bryobacterales bacterium]
MSKPSELGAHAMISLVIPVHNEEEDVQELARRIHGQLQDGYEIIFVDDGSTDATWERLRAIADPPRIQAIRFRRNFGKAAGLMAGFAASRGELVFTMDGDLQDDPAEIPRFLAKLEEGYDVIAGYKRKRHDPLNKVIASRIFNYVVRKLTKVDLHDMNCGFKLYRGQVAREVRIYGELHRFIPALAAAEGYRIGEIEVQHHARQHGKSKYGISRLFKGFVDLITTLLITTYRTRPAHGFGWAALASMALSVVIALVSLPFTAGVEVYLFGKSFDLSWLGPALWIKSLFFAVTAVVLMAAGWVAEVVIRAPLSANPAQQYAVEERLE